MFDQNILSALKELNLTEYESKVYSALIAGGTLSAKDLSSFSKISYSKIYEVINALSVKGFVKTIPTKPMKYQAVAPDEIITLIKQERIDRLNHVDRILKRLHKNKTPEVTKDKFFILNGRKTINKEIKNLIKNTKNNLKIYSNKEGLKRIRFFLPMLKELKNKNVDIRIITNSKDKEAVKRFGRYDLTRTNHVIASNMISADGNEAVIYETKFQEENELQENDVGILISNSAFIKIMGNIFITTSDKKRAEAELKESEEKYKTIFNSANDAIYVIDKDGNFISANTKTAQLLNTTPEKLVGKNLKEIFPPKVISSQIKKIKRLHRTGEHHRINDVEIQTPIGKMCFNSKLTPIKKDGKIAYVMGISRDVTEQNNFIKKLKESEQKFKTIFEGASDGIIAADTKTKKLVFANPQLLELTGYSKEEITDLKVSDLHPKKDLPCVLAKFQKQAQGEITLAKDIPVLKKDGKVIYCDVNSAPIRIGDRELLLGFFRDTCQSKRRKR